MADFPFNVFVSFQYRERDGEPERVLVVSKAHRHLVAQFPGMSWSEGDPVDLLFDELYRIVHLKGKARREHELRLIFEDLDYTDRHYER